MSSSTSTCQHISIGLQERFNVNKILSKSRYTVYQGFDTESNQDVAIKFFEVKGTVDKNYNNEKMIITNFDHPNIIKVIQTSDKERIILQREQKEFSYICFEFAKYGDVFEVISNYGRMSEILVRTMFHNLVEAVSHIHSKNYAHMDLKLENLLLDENLNLKITDFDLSQPLKAEGLVARGTPGYRAPEMKDGSCYDYAAADIYSLGVILFILLTGYPPYSEKDRGYGHDYDGFYKMLRKNNKRFWELHSEHLKIANLYSQEFKDLVNGMLTEEPKYRLKLDDIKNSVWYHGPTLRGEAYNIVMDQYLKRI